MSALLCYFLGDVADVVSTNITEKFYQFSSIQRWNYFSGGFRNYDNGVKWPASDGGGACSLKLYNFVIIAVVKFKLS